MKLITVRRVEGRERHYYGVGVLHKRGWRLLRWHHQVPLQLIYTNIKKARACAAHIRKQLRGKRHASANR